MRNGRLQALTGFQFPVSGFPFSILSCRHCRLTVSIDSQAVRLVRSPGNEFPGSVGRNRLKPTPYRGWESPSGDFSKTQPGNSFPGLASATTLEDCSRADGQPPQNEGRTFAVLRLLLVLTALAVALPAHAQYPWVRLPVTPTLPTPERSGSAPVNGVRLWYAVFGHGAPVILVHGGLANSDYWGLQVAALAPHYRVIVLDSRGHGRSTRTEAPISYDLMASDVLALMDFLHVRQAALVGWSDGAIIGLDIAIHHPERLTRLFAFAANSDPSGVKDVSKSPMFTSFTQRAAHEYETLSPTPKQFKAFLANITNMWATEPHFTDAQLSQIKVPTWIVDGDHDEAIKRENTDHMAGLIPGAGELILPEVGHFAFLQDPVLFNQALLHFLARP
jgi:pimeloyl-ACP methyl ester carboxylesterase